MVFSCKWLLLLPSSVSVQGLVCVHYFIRLAILLCGGIVSCNYEFFEEFVAT